MAVTSNELLQNILTSINNALQNIELTEDNRSALIDQYDRTISMIRDGFEYIEVGVDSLPTVIRDETILLLNEVIATFENVSQTLLASLTSDAQTINTNLSSQVDAKITDISDSLSAFETSATDLKTLLVSDAQTINTNLSSQVDAKIVDLSSLPEVIRTETQALVNVEIQSLDDWKNSLNSSLFSANGSMDNKEYLLLCPISVSGAYFSGRIDFVNWTAPSSFELFINIYNGLFCSGSAVRSSGGIDILIVEYEGIEYACIKKNGQLNVSFSFLGCGGGIVPIPVGVEDVNEIDIIITIA